VNSALQCGSAFADELWWGLQLKDDSVSNESKSSPWGIFPKPVVYVIMTCLALGAMAAGSSALVKLGKVTAFDDRLTGVETRMDGFDKTAIAEQNARKASDEKLDRFIWQYEQFRKVDATTALASDRKLDEILKSMNAVTATVTSMQMDASTRNVTIESKLNAIKEQSLNAFDVANAMRERVADIELKQAVEAKKP